MFHVHLIHLENLHFDVEMCQHPDHVVPTTHIFITGSTHWNFGREIENVLWIHSVPLWFAGMETMAVLDPDIVNVNIIVVEWHDFEDVT